MAKTQKPKKRGKHSTIMKSTKKFVSKMERLGAKVILGRPESARHRYAPGAIRFSKDIDGGIEVKAYDGKGVRKIFIRTDDKEAVLKAIGEMA